MPKLKILICDTAIKKQSDAIKKVIEESEYSGSTFYVTRNRREASHILKNENPDLMITIYNYRKNGDRNNTIEFVKNHSETPTIVLDDPSDNIGMKIWELKARPLYMDEIDDLPVEIYRVLNPAKANPEKKINKVLYDPIKKVFSQE